jgi:hypothetical protein
MKTIWKSAVLGAAFVGLFVGAASAQETIAANIPFPFEIGHEVAPAGRYRLTLDSGILSVRGQNVHAGVFASTTPAAGHDPDGSTPALVFTRGETGYRLSAVWESDDEGRALPNTGAFSAPHDKAAHDQSNNQTIVIPAGTD